MTDRVNAEAGNTGTAIVTRSRTTGTPGDVAVSLLATFAGGAETLVDGTNPLPVTAAVTSLPNVTIGAALPAGTNALGSVSVSNLPTTQAVSSAGLSNLDVALSSVATQTTLAAVLAKIIAAPATESTLASVLAALSSALPLPIGASTAARQDTGNVSLASILSGLSALATSAAQATAQTSLTAIVAALGPLATQTTVAAILSALQGTLTVGLPSGAATSAAQGTGNASLASIDGHIVACNTGAVTVSACALPSGASTAALQSTGNTTLASILSGLGAVVLAAGSAVIGHVITDAGSTTAVSSSALPTGASTSAAQTTGNASLTSIDGKITAVNTGAVVVSSSALPTGAATSALQGGGLPAALGAGGGVKVDGSGAALPVSLAALPALITGAATIGAVTGPGAVALAKDSTLTDGTQRIGGTVTISGAVTTSGTVTEASGATIATNTGTTATNTGTVAGAVSGGRVLTTEASAASILAKLDVALSTRAVESGGNLATLATNLPAKGQALAAASMPVVLTAIQSAALAQDATLTGGTQKAIATDSGGTAVFAAAAAAADASTNATTVTQIGARIEALNDAGTPTWDRVRAGITTIGSAFTGMLNALPWGIFHTTPSTRTNGQGGPLETDNGGSLLINGGAGALFDVKDRAARLLGALTGVNGSSVATGANPVPVGSYDVNGNLAGPIAGWDSTTNGGTALPVAGLTIKASTGIYDGFVGVNGSAGAAYLQVHNLSSASGYTATTLVAVSNAAATTTTASLSVAGGIKCGTGITLVWSTTQFTYTSVVTGTGNFVAYYK